MAPKPLSSPANAREELEREIRRRCEEGDLAGAAAAALRGYGPEILGLLLSLHRSDVEAQEVFSAFAERLWRGLPGFAWECSFRTWAFVVARRASLNHRRDQRLRDLRNVPLPDGSALSAIAEQVRSATLSSMDEDRRARIEKLRRSLSPEERMILALRIDKGLAWNDLARVMRDEDAPPLDDEGTKRDAARLRKRFQSIKDKLVEQARREGLLGKRGD